MRIDGRRHNQLRKVTIERNYIQTAEGSALISIGNTRVICTASIEEKTPHFLRNTGQGWITAEYSMLPRATHTRTVREASKGKVSGRTMEIQRLIGRVLRSVVNLKDLGERTIWLDCDVIQADGGTRTASITGAFVAMVDALAFLVKNKTLRHLPVTDFLAATSVGIVDDQIFLDLCYEEDSSALVDMNVVMTGSGEFVELQGAAEESPFRYDQLIELLEVAKKGVQELIQIQREALKEYEEWFHTTENMVGGSQ